MQLSLVGAGARDQLSVLQALLPGAAALPRHGLRLGRADGVRGAARRGAAGRLAAVPDHDHCGPASTTRSTRWSTATTTGTIGIRSTALLFGDMDRVAIGAMQLIMLWGLGLVGRRAWASAVAYWAGLSVAALLFGWQQWLARGREAGSLLSRPS
jgi:hypothetical protein